MGNERITNISIITFYIEYDGIVYFIQKPITDQTIKNFSSGCLSNESSVQDLRLIASVCMVYSTHE